MTDRDAVREYTMSDQMLRQHVLDELNREPGLDATGIDVSATGDVIMLSGVVPTYAEKVAAERAAKRVDGVRGVASDLDVKLRAHHHRDDAVVAEAALEALRWNRPVDAARLRVRVADGWVRLEGTVDRPDERAAAEAALEHVVGVVGVTNLIAVHQPAPTPAMDVKARIEAALRRRAELAAYDATQIHVETRGDHVVLWGTVHSWADRAAAEAAAWAAPGIVAVDDELQVVAPADA
jgi:osmotically-inducible protein OsmY